MKHFEVVLASLLFGASIGAQAFQSSSRTSFPTRRGQCTTTTSLSFANWYRQKLVSEYAASLEPTVVAVATTTASDKSSDDANKTSKSAKLKRIWTKTTSKVGRLVEKVSSVVATVKAKAKTEPSSVNVPEADSAVATAPVMATSSSSSPAAPKRKVKPLSRRKQDKMAAKYAAIDDLEERAYTILKDLGMVEPTLDFSI